MKPLDIKINSSFEGKVVRKDLTKIIKGNAIVPTYVLEYLLGQYCATDQEETILEGVETVKAIIAAHFVHRDESQVIKSTIREKGSHRIIDKVAVKLNDRQDRYEASFANLGLTGVPIADNIIKAHQKLLSSGVWCILTLAYLASDERGSIPWIVESLKPIQVSNVDIEEYKRARADFSQEEWMDMLLQSIGLNPDEFTFRSKLLQLTRLVPFVENNYNLIELGPKGTGKSHIYSEMSPHGILISGGEVSKAKLFVNNSTGDIGLVGYWDVVAYDEFAGKTKRADRGLVDILKNYMANRTFSRGTDVYSASASMVFVGNTDHSVSYMLKHNNLFKVLPEAYYDTAFLDRMHAYLPGWEVQKLRNEMFTENYGFIVDYLAEVLRFLRREDRTNDYTKFFELSASITTRDKTAIAKTYAGLTKILFPDDEYTEEQAKPVLDFAIENRKRVKEQLMKMDETFEAVDFSYTSKSTGEECTVETLEEVEYGQAPSGEKDLNAKTEPLDPEKPETKPVLDGKQKIIRDNQTGISYDTLFGAYLEGATSYHIIDPYVRLPYQLRNLMELAKLIYDKKNPDTEVSIHLVTSNNEEYLESVRENFKQMTLSLEALDINFTYEFDDYIHDRSITMDNGWKIILGRGLDIWSKTGGYFDISEYMQERRACKGCEITFVKS